MIKCINIFGSTEHGIELSLYMEVEQDSSELKDVRKLRIKISMLKDHDRLQTNQCDIHTYDYLEDMKPVLNLTSIDPANNGCVAITSTGSTMIYDYHTGLLDSTNIDTTNTCNNGHYRNVDEACEQDIIHAPSCDQKVFALDGRHYKDSKQALTDSDSDEIVSHPCSEMRTDDFCCNVYPEGEGHLNHVEGKCVNLIGEPSGPHVESDECGEDSKKTSMIDGINLGTLSTLGQTIADDSMSLVQTIHKECNSQLQSPKNRDEITFDDIVCKIESVANPSEYISKTAKNMKVKKYAITRNLKHPDKLSPSARKRGKSPHTCSICDKEFCTRWVLKEHMITHTGERKHQCSVCGKLFPSGPRLNKHMRTHTGEKPYKCTTCDRRFAAKSNLNSHMMIHTGEKRHLCATCGKKFTHRSDLNQHLKTHSGEKQFKCDSCDKKFLQKIHLTCHMRTHTGEKPHKCITCGRQFSSKARLNEHFMRTHAAEENIT